MHKANDHGAFGNIQSLYILQIHLLPTRIKEYVLFGRWEYGNTYLKNLLVCPHAWCSCAAEGHAPARQKMRHNKPSDSSHRRNRDNIPSLSLHLPCCTARCGPRSTSLSLFSPSIHLSLHVRTTLRPSPTAGRHSFTSDGLIMAPLSLRSLDRTWSAHSVALSPSFCRLHAHTHTHMHGNAPVHSG